MKDSRILLHYIKRLSSSTSTQANTVPRRLSAVRALIQKQIRKYDEGVLPNLNVTLKNQLSQWPLGLNYYNKLKYRCSGVAIDWRGQKLSDNPVLYSTRDNFNDLGERQKERFQKANRKLKERKDILIKEIQETKEHVRQQVDDIIAKENIYTVPNLLCVLRIGSSPVLSYLILTQQYYSAIGIFAFAGVTDLLDGYIARNVPGQASVFGSFLDPLSDKILVATLFLSLTYIGIIPVPLTTLIIARDVGLVGAAFFIRYKSLEPPRTLAKYFDLTHPSAQLAPTYISKVNTGIQLGLVGSALISTVLPFDVSGILTGVCWLTAATTVGSGVSYLFAKNTVKLLRTRKKVDKTSQEKK